MRSCCNGITFLPWCQPTRHCICLYPISSWAPVAVPPSEYHQSCPLTSEEFSALWITLWHSRISPIHSGVRLKLEFVNWSQPSIARVGSAVSSAMCNEKRVEEWTPKQSQCGFYHTSLHSDKAVSTSLACNSKRSSQRIPSVISRSSVDFALIPEYHNFGFPSTFPSLSHKSSQGTLCSKCAFCVGTLTLWCSHVQKMVFPSWLVIVPRIIAIVLPTCKTSLWRRIVVP